MLEVIYYSYLKRRSILTKNEKTRVICTIVTGIISELIFLYWFISQKSNIFVFISIEIIIVIVDTFVAWIEANYEKFDKTYEIK